MSRKLKDFLTLLLQLALDAGAVYLTFYLAYSTRFKFDLLHPGAGPPPISRYLRLMPVVIILFLVVFKWAGLYDTHRIIYKTDEFLAIIKSSVIAFFIITAGTFMYREYEYSRLMFAYAFFYSVGLVYLSHRLLSFFSSRVFFPMAGSPGILLIGGGRTKKQLAKNIHRVGRYDVFHLDGIDFKNIKNLSAEHNIGEIILVDMDVDRNIVMDLLNYCEKNDIEFKMVPDMLELKMGELGYDRYFGIPVLKLKHPLNEPVNYYFKRITDIIMCMAFLMLSTPLLLVLFMLIKLDSPGPVFYSQTRKGFKGNNFPFFKFRSMVTDAEDSLKSLMKYNERPGAVFKIKKDPRVTRVGRFIRKYSLDEVPQLFNVLRGDMSLVGPRPQILRETEYYDDTAKRRLNIRPGITGLWQGSGRSDLSYDEMIKLDLYYLENWTPGLDVKILLKTITVVVLRKGAY